MGKKLGGKAVWVETGSWANFWVRVGGGWKAKVLLSYKRESQVDC